jgi:tetratricopeptide (TPR) repeat protein
LTARRSHFPYTDALTHFARAVAFARSGRPDEASAHLDALRAAVETLRGKDAYWMEQVDIQRQSAEGWVAFAKGEREAGLDALRQAAEREAKTEKHVVTPGPLAPAREQLAEMLLEMNQPDEALKEFESVQSSEPNRFRAIHGAGRAAEMSGRGDVAKRHYAKLVEIAGASDSARPELEAAKRYLAQN